LQTSRETFASRFGLLMTMIGVAVGLGNVWRFPYMVGQFGGAPFVVFYVFVVGVIGVPALMAEWTLGRLTRRGPVGAFAQAGLPFGRPVGWFFFFVVTAATGYYTNALGWVLYYAGGGLADTLGLAWESSEILPPNEGFVARSFFLQMTCTGLVILACVAVLLKGLRSGIERVSKVIMPTLLTLLLILIARSLTLPGAGSGLHWYLVKVDLSAFTGQVMLAALGQAVFSLSLGGTFMVVYGSYLNPEDRLRSNAVWTASGDVIAGILAGLAIFPAVFAMGLEPTSGPGLIFATLPQVFGQIPGALRGGVPVRRSGFRSARGRPDGQHAPEPEAGRLADGCRRLLDSPASDDQHGGLRAVGPDVRIGHADAGCAAVGDHGGLGDPAVGGAEGAGRRGRGDPADLALLLAALRHSRRHRPRRPVVGVDGRARRGDPLRDPSIARGLNLLKRPVLWKHG
jgi:hypothetical protein